MEYTDKVDETMASFARALGILTIGAPGMVVTYGCMAVMAARMWEGKIPMSTAIPLIEKIVGEIYKKLDEKEVSIKDTANILKLIKDGPKEVN